MQQVPQRRVSGLLNHFTSAGTPFESVAREACANSSVLDRERRNASFSVEKLTNVLVSLTQSKLFKSELGRWCSVYEHQKVS
jgi:hypothetical protein